MNEPEPIIPPEDIRLGLGDTGFDAHLLAQTSADVMLELPQDGLVGLRKSGGIRFSSRDVIVLRSGWMVQHTHDTALRPRRIRPSMMASLRRLTLRTQLGRYPQQIGRATPDGFSYELAARIDRVVHHVTVHDGSIPPTLEPLIRVLSRMLPER